MRNKYSLWILIFLFFLCLRFTVQAQKSLPLKSSNQVWQSAMEMFQNKNQYWHQKYKNYSLKIFLRFLSYQKCLHILTFILIFLRCVELLRNNHCLLKQRGSVCSALLSQRQMGFGVLFVLFNTRKQ